MGLILPEKRFLSDVRKITKQHDVPLIFDEVVTGFRVSEGGAQKTFKVKPDITTLLARLLETDLQLPRLEAKRR